MTTSTGITIIGAFRNWVDAQAAAQDLQDAGVRKENIYLESSSAQGEDYQSRSSHSEGGVAGWLKGFFEPLDDADYQRYEKAIQSGSFLLSVDTEEDQISMVEQIINRHSPLDVHSDGMDPSSTKAEEGNQAFKDGAGKTASPRSDAGDSGVIPIVKEDLAVGKRRILSGGVRVYTRVVTRPVEETVSLREEHVRVDRRPVDRAATEADFDAGREKVIEMDEYAEKAVVGKQSRVVEEIRVGKEVNQRKETVQDSVRHTEVDVQPVESDDDAPLNRPDGSE